MIRQSSHVYLMLRRHFLMSSVAARIINLWKLFLTVEPDVDYKTVTLVFLHEVTRLIAPTKRSRYRFHCNRRHKFDFVAYAKSKRPT